MPSPRKEITLSIEFIGLVHTAPGSEGLPGAGPLIQPGYVAELARAHEASDFDRVLIAHWSSAPDALTVANHVLTATERLGVLIAHRPGFVSPTVAARIYATIDAFHPGRTALHVISGGDDADQARDGDISDKPTRYRRSDEFLQVLRQEWTSAEPFDFEGEFYTVRGGFSAVRPREGDIPIFFGGASSDAIRVGAKHADAYAFWGEPLAGIAERITEVRAAAAQHGRDPRFSVSLRPIVADTEEAAWEKAHGVLEATNAGIEKFRKTFAFGNNGGERPSGSQRLLDVAARGDVHDTRLWTAVAKATGAPGNTTALVGTVEQVSDALLEYVKLGVSTLLIRGFDPLPDAIAYRDVISQVRARAEAEGLGLPGLNRVGARSGDRALTAV
jgi:alkanesulfonate monooxygenase